MHRKNRGCGGVATSFPETIAHWRAAHPEDSALTVLAAEFMQSEAFEGYKEIPFAGLGSCLEEAFYRYCESSDVGEPAQREHEFLGAMVRALAISPEPAFSIPDEIRRGSSAWYGVSQRSAPVLYIALPSGTQTGPITPFLRDLLLSGSDPKAVASRHRVSPQVLEASLAKVKQLGVL